MILEVHCPLKRLCIVFGIKSILCNRFLLVAQFFPAADDDKSYALMRTAITLRRLKGDIFQILENNGIFRFQEGEEHYLRCVMLNGILKVAQDDYVL